MRLRYIHLPDYGPLQDVAVVFGQNQHIEKRRGAVNFVVGLNGTGKSSLLRAIYDVFHSLSREELPKFPVTIAYDMEVDARWDELDVRWGGLSRDEFEEANTHKFVRQTVIFHRPKGSASDAFLVPAADCLPFTQAEEWQDYVEKALAPKGNADSLGYYVAGDRMKGDGNLRNWLPTRVLAYTTGETDPWNAMTYPIYPKDELVDDPQEFDPEQERPSDWSEHQEYYDMRIPTVGDPAWDAPFGGKKDSADLSQRCMLLRPEDAKLAAVSLGIWQAAFDLEGMQEEWQREIFREARQKEIAEESTPENVARRAFNALDWLWPTHAAFHFSSLARTMGHRDAARCYWVLALASSVVRHPLEESLAVVRLGNCPPIAPSSLTGGEKIDLENEGSLHYMANPMANAHCGAEALRSLFAGERDPQESLWTLFSTLREWRDCGLLKDVDLTVQRIRKVIAADGEPDDRIHSYDSFSDGERMLLGRVAFLLLLRQQNNTLLLLDEPETHFNDAWKRQLIDMVDGALLKDTSAQVLISTHTSLALTDVFSCEITRFVKEEGVTRSKPVAHPTFGADPGRLLLHVFGAPDVIGARAAEFLREKLRKVEWSAEEREKLRELVDEIGSGWPRAKLVELLDELDGNQREDLPHVTFDS
jgi:predicted ATPase